MQSRRSKDISYTYIFLGDEPRRKCLEVETVTFSEFTAHKIILLLSDLGDLLLWQ